jgi:hypothetical protein
MTEKSYYCCTYDNPNTMMRECWYNGKLQAAYAMELYYLKEWPIPPHFYHMGANIGDWENRTAYRG